MPDTKESLFKTYIKHPGMWINALLGKPSTISIPQNQVQYQDPTQPQPAPQTPPPPHVESVPREVSPQNDSVNSDLEKAKALLHEVTGKIEEAAKPLVDKGVQTAQGAIQSSNSVIAAKGGAQSLVKKVVPTLLFIGVLIVVIIGGYTVIRNMNKGDSPAIVTGPTPTSAEYVPSQPSLYSEDPEVLKLEQDISLLQREITGTSLRETTLNPPVLDFNISF